MSLCASYHTAIFLYTKWLESRLLVIQRLSFEEGVTVGFRASCVVSVSNHKLDHECACTYFPVQMYVVPAGSLAMSFHCFEELLPSRNIVTG